MKKLLVGAVAAMGLWAAAAAQADAQGLGPYTAPSIRPFDMYNQPNLSPYLNLLRSGDPAANYYLGVVPEIQRRAFTNRALQDFQSLYRQTAPTRDLLEDIFREPLIRTLPPTGHATAFQNYGTYFNYNRR